MTSPALTPRQEAVLRLLAAGHTDRQIARTLHISAATVKNHCTKLYRALDLDRNRHQRVQATCWWLTHVTEEAP